jgi:Subtilase family
MPDEVLPHIRVRRERITGYRNPRSGGGAGPPPPERDRASHARRLLEDIDRVRDEIAAEPPSAPGAEGSLATVEVSPEATIPVESLADRATEVVVVHTTADSAVLHLRRSDISALYRKIERFGNPELVTSTGRPRHETLVAPIEGVRRATLADLADGGFDANEIDGNRTYWVELWVRGGRLESEAERQRVFSEILWFVEAHGSDPERIHHFHATERDMYLLSLTGAALFRLPSDVPEVYSVRPPGADIRDLRIFREADGQGTADRFNQPAPNAGTVAILDTGVALRHPYLRSALRSDGVSVVPGDLSPGDTHGHGTNMAGIAAFTDIGGQLATGAIRPDNWLLNGRLLARDQSDDSDREFWPERTAEAVSALEAEHSGPIVFNLSIGARNPFGDRTSWSVAMDTLAHNAGSGRLFVVAAGNVDVDPVREIYPTKNLAGALDDPAHALNVLTVGGITNKETLPTEPEFGDLIPLASAGEISPYSTASLGGNAPIKPEIVLEGGNCAPDGDLPNTGIETLSVMTCHHRHAEGRLLSHAWATSAATAAASNLAARVWSANPSIRPETLRALIVHSASWPSALTTQLPDRVDLLRTAGYGVPEFQDAAHSWRERPTLILEDQLRPALQEAESGNARPLHLVRLPLPDAQLVSLGASEVELRVTLSYFAETNESNRRRYQGASLRWDMQGPVESEEEFIRRINLLARDDGYQRSSSSFPWTIGVQARSRGSVQSDRWVGPATDLAGQKLVAVYPVPGWWDGRTDREDAVVDYSLVVSIDVGSADVDLYSLIQSAISVSVQT